MLYVRNLGPTDYAHTWQAMQEFTETRDAETADELWLTEHPAVFTLGLNGKPGHLLRKNGIPLIRVDRGGQITYHGPGQIVLYLLLDLRRRNLGVRQLITLMEQAVINLLMEHGIASERHPNAPGIYVKDAKIAALGLRVRRGCSYHGLALNVDMDLAPYDDINPCGYSGMAVTQIRDLGVRTALPELADDLLRHLIKLLEENKT